MAKQAGPKSGKKWSINIYSLAQVASMTMTNEQFQRELVELELSIMVLTIQILKDSDKFSSDELNEAIDKATSTIQAGKA
jgi:hypothetical protein